MGSLRVGHDWVTELDWTTSRPADVQHSTGAASQARAKAALCLLLGRRQEKAPRTEWLLGFILQQGSAGLTITWWLVPGLQTPCEKHHLTPRGFLPPPPVYTQINPQMVIYASGFSEVSKNRGQSSKFLAMLDFYPQIISNLVEFTKTVWKQHKTGSSPMIALTEKLYWMPALDRTWGFCPQEFRQEKQNYCGKRSEFITAGREGTDPIPPWYLDKYKYIIHSHSKKSFR